MTTALSTNVANQAVAIYSKIDNPMVAIQELGKLFQQSQIMGISTPGDGAVLALTCMCEGITPLEFAKTYHIIQGKPAMRADMMAAKFRAAGGKINWKNLGDDGKVASADFVFEGTTIPIQYTVEDARKLVGDRLDKPGDSWNKDRGAMLRARLITKSIRILAPELIAGVYTPEELDDAGISQPAPNDNKQAIAERRAELLAEHEQAVRASASNVTEGEIVQPSSVPVQESAETVSGGTTQVTEEAPFNDDDEPATNELLQEIVKVGSKIPSAETPGSGMSVQEIASGVCAACKVDNPTKATRGQIRKLIARFREQLGEK